MSLVLNCFIQVVKSCEEIKSVIILYALLRKFFVEFTNLSQTVYFGPR